MARFLLPGSLTGSPPPPPPPPDVVARALAELPDRVPAQLVALYEVCDGFRTDSGVGVHAAVDLVERNATFEVAEYAPGYLLVGDDSGGRGFLLHAATPVSPVFASGLGDLDPAGFAVVGPDLQAWVLGLT